MSRSGNRFSLNSPSATRAKRIRFYHNGNQYFNGIILPVSPERYQSFDSLTKDLTNVLLRKVPLHQGIRSVYNMEGKKISSLEELEDGQSYVCSGPTEAFKKVDYGETVKAWNSSLMKFPNLDSGAPKMSIPSCVRPLFVTVVRNGSRPRKIVRLFLSKRNGASWELVMRAMTDAVKLDSGAVRKIFTSTGQPVTTIEEIFEEAGYPVFFVYGSERHNPEDFMLSEDEVTGIEAHKKMIRRES